MSRSHPEVAVEQAALTQYAPAIILSNDITTVSQTFEPTEISPSYEPAVLTDESQSDAGRQLMGQYGLNYNSAEVVVENEERRQLIDAHERVWSNIGGSSTRDTDVFRITPVQWILTMMFVFEACLAMWILMFSPRKVDGLISCIPFSTILVLFKAWSCPHSKKNAVFQSIATYVLLLLIYLISISLATMNMTPLYDTAWGRRLGFYIGHGILGSFVLYFQDQSAIPRNESDLSVEAQGDLRKNKKISFDFHVAIIPSCILAIIIYMIHSSIIHGFSAANLGYSFLCIFFSLLSAYFVRYHTRSGLMATFFQSALMTIVFAVFWALITFLNVVDSFLACVIIASFMFSITCCLMQRRFVTDTEVPSTTTITTMYGDFLTPVPGTQGS